MVQERDKAIELLEKILESREENQHTIIPIMGGDGTPARLIDYLILNSPIIEKNLHVIAFAILPFGTGNDLSRSQGWGGEETS